MENNKTYIIEVELSDTFILNMERISNDTVLISESFLNHKPHSLIRVTPCNSFQQALKRWIGFTGLDKTTATELNEPATVIDYTI